MDNHSNDVTTSEALEITSVDLDHGPLAVGVAASASLATEIEMPVRRLIALFDKYGDAHDACRDLLVAGIAAERMGLLTNNVVGAHPTPVTNPIFALPRDETIGESAEVMALGMTAGGGVGAVVGGAMALGSLVVPGAAAIVATGFWVPFYTALCSAIGGAIVALKEVGVPDEDAELYAEGVRRGGTLLFVEAEGRDSQRICGIFDRYGACDIEARARGWRAEGWVGFDTQSVPEGASRHRHLTSNA